MIMRYFLSAGVLASSLCLQAAELLSPKDANQLLNRVAAAARTQNYSGVYLYQHSEGMETFRLLHIAEAGNESERREALDGPQREFVRNNDQITCYLPENKSFTIDRRSTNKLFPSLLPDQPADVLNNYVVRRLDAERVAGLQSEVYMLEPKDRFRHPHKLWVDAQSGLLLKAAMLDQQHYEPIEQFTFTQVQVGGVVDKRLLKPLLVNKPTGTEKPVSVESLTAQGLEFKAVPPGFRLVKESQRNLPGKSVPVKQYLFSDGLATVSLFVEPVVAGSRMSPPVARREVSVFTRQAGSFHITVLGEVPETTAQQFGQAVNPK